MRVLVVHDRADVANNIRALLLEREVPAGGIVVVGDGTSARREMTRQMFDLLIIDLTLPHIAGVGAPSYQVANDLLREVFLLGDLRTPGDIIGITKDSAALDRVGSEIGGHVMTIIEEDAAGTWKAKLSDKLLYTCKVAEGRQLATNSQFDFDCAIITALDKEMRPYQDYFEFSESEIYPGLKQFSFKSNDGVLRKGAAYSVGKSGEARAASHAQSLLSLTRPKLMIMSGICGGVRGKTKLGDLVIAESAIDWDYGKWSEEDPPASTSTPPEPVEPKFFSRPNPVSIVGSKIHMLVREILNSDYLAEPSVKKRIGEISHGLISDPEFHLAPMASGSAVIASDTVLNSVRNLNESIRGIDMECFGMYQAAATTHVVKPDFVCLKSVSDFSNGQKDDRYHVAASSFSALVALEIISNRWSFT